MRTMAGRKGNAKHLRMKRTDKALERREKVWDLQVGGSESNLKGKKAKGVKGEWAERTVEA